MHYKDACNHGTDCYVGSFTFLDRWVDDGKAAYKSIKYDVYVYVSGGEQEVCLRFGDDGPEYLSPGPLYLFLRSSVSDELYEKAVALLVRAGRITWQRR